MECHAIAMLMDISRVQRGAFRYKYARWCLDPECRDRPRHVAGGTIRSRDCAGTTSAHSSCSSNNEECRAIVLVDLESKMFRCPTLHSWRRISRQDNACLPRQCDIPLINGMKTHEHDAHKRHDNVLHKATQFPIRLLSFDCLVHCSVIHFAATLPAP